MRILIVEDEPKAREGLAALVQRLEGSACVQTASNGTEALTLCEKNVFDVIFTDIRMPKMSGLELIQRLDAYCQQIVIVSGYADFSYAQTAIQHGVADYLLKPVSPSKFKELLGQLRKNVHAIKQVYLASYLQDYEFLEEDYRQYLRQRLDLGDSGLALYGERSGKGDEAWREWTERLSGFSGDIYTLAYANRYLCVISGMYEEQEVRSAAVPYGLAVQHVPVDQLPDFYRRLIGAEPVRRHNDTESSRIVRLVKQFIQENYASEISLEVLSKISYLHPNYLSKIFKRETGENISDYILSYRIEQAKRLLMDPSLKIYEVAEKSGFHTSKYFAALFKTEVGITPSQYRDSL